MQSTGMVKPHASAATNKMQHSAAVLLKELHARVLCKAARNFHMQLVLSILIPWIELVIAKAKSSLAFRTRGSSQLNTKSSDWGPRAGSAVPCTWICQCCWKT